MQKCSIVSFPKNYIFELNPVFPALEKQVVTVQVNWQGKPLGNIFPTPLCCALESET